MAITYILEHQGNNGHPKVCKEQRKFFQSEKIPFQSLDWPTGSGSGFSAGENQIESVKSKFDFSTLKKPFIALNGRGELHGRTFFFVDALEKDIIYYQIDAHMDTGFADEGEVGCENHVHQTMQLAHVKKINLLRINPFNLTDGLGYFMGDEDSGYFQFAPSPAMHDPKVELYLGECWGHSKARAIKTSHYSAEHDIELLERYGRKYLIDKQFNPANDPVANAYISIDLDAIRGFPTGWPKAGVWTTEKVIETIEQIGQCKQVVGADICGLCLSSPPERFLTLSRKQQALEDIVKIHKTLQENMS